MCLICQSRNSNRRAFIVLIMVIKISNVFQCLVEPHAFAGDFSFLAFAGFSLLMTLEALSLDLLPSIINKNFLCVVSKIKNIDSR